MSIKELMEGLPKTLPDLEESCPICLLTKAAEISIDPTIYISKFAPGFMV